LHLSGLYGTRHLVRRASHSHWVDGGETDLANGTLLCGRHHTIVHRDRLTARVTPSGVQWNRIRGSYDRAPAVGIDADDASARSPP
jgi:hypothetical protein